MDAGSLISYLDEYLRISEIPDYKGALNGLQVAGTDDIGRIATAVDACQATIDEAVSNGAHLLIVHHGLFWGGSAPITGMLYRRLSALIRGGISLYSCHLPLDVHPEVGNNHVLARSLGLSPDATFEPFEGVPVGVSASADLTLPELVTRVRDVLRAEPLVLAKGPDRIRRIGVLTGAGGSSIAGAEREGIDTLLTGEGAHHTYFEAEERGINVIYAGHYATETVGVRALADHLRERFGLETSFIDHPTGL